MRRKQFAAPRFLKVKPNMKKFRTPRRKQRDYLKYYNFTVFLFAQDEIEFV